MLLTMMANKGHQYLKLFETLFEKNNERKY